ncbi:MAG: hypothetical protein WB643_07030 [Candidatus Bathyarchaeia archaeon]
MAKEMTAYHDAGEAIFANKIVIIFKSKLNVQPAEDQPELSFARIQGDPARAIIPETVRLVK